MSLRTTIQIHGEAVDRLEDLYQQHAGEVTPEVEAAEAEAKLAGNDLLDAHARYQCWIADQHAAIERERERLAGLEASLVSRKQWSDGEIQALLERHHAGRRSVQVGTRKIATRVTYRADVAPEVDAATLPAGLRRTIPGKPATPDREAPDANAIKDHWLEKVPGSKPVQYRERWHEGEPPIDGGWYEVEGRGRAWLYQARERWFISKSGGTGPSLEHVGLSIEAKPGLDLLRWRHAPDGVRVSRHVHVKVK